MKELLALVSEWAITAIDGVALLIVIYACAEANVGVVLTQVRRSSNQEGRSVWLRFARWLVAALTFQLAADIIETSIRTDWAVIARVAAVAVIRTFLNYFLERDVTEIRERRDAYARSHSSAEPPR